MIWIREFVLSTTSTVIINLFDLLLHRMNKSIKFAHPVLIMPTTLDAAERQYSVVQDPAYVGWLAWRMFLFVSRGTIKDLTDKVYCEGHDFVYFIRLAS